MIKLLRIILSAIIILSLTVSCNEFTSSPLEPVLNGSGDTTLYPARVYIIDSCEYVHIGDSWAHKGNCKNCRKYENEKIDRIIGSFRARYSK